MAQFGDVSLRTWMVRERMHFHRLLLDEQERLRQEAAIARAAERRRRQREVGAAWRRLVEQMME